VSGARPLLSVTLDQACIALMALAAVGGALLGALSQVSQLGAMSAGWAGARLLGPGVASLLRGKVPAFAAHPIGSMLAFAGCAATAAVILRAFLRLAGAGKVPGSGPDRGLGALLGAAQASVFLWVALSALATWGRPIQIGRVHLDPTHSDLVAFAAEHNALGTVSGIRRRAAQPPSD
jgi:membrane protein required for colicin V production